MELAKYAGVFMAVHGCMPIRRMQGVCLCVLLLCVRVCVAVCGGICLSVYGHVRSLPWPCIGLHLVLDWCVAGAGGTDRMGCTCGRQSQVVC